MNAKWMLLFLGALVLIGCVLAGRQEDSGELDSWQKRRIIKDMLRTQNELRRALMKIREQILSGDRPDYSGENSGSAPVEAAHYGMG